MYLFILIMVFYLSQINHMYLTDNQLRLRRWLGGPVNVDQILFCNTHNKPTGMVVMSLHNTSAFYRRGRGRTQMSLLPRSLQISQNAAATTPSSTAIPFSNTASSNGSNSNSATNGDGAGDTQKQMSNSDFRQMLLGTKK